MKFKILVPIVLAVFLLSVALVPALPSYAVTCQSAGSTGLTALIVATPGETISGETMSAAGCDVAIYVGPGANHVSISGNYITGANDHGIFVQDANFVTISHNTVTGNQLSTHPDCPIGGAPVLGCIAEDKAVELVGSSHSLIIGNNVSYNLGSPGGGIGISDDGAWDPGAPFGHAGNAMPANHNTIADNLVTFNLADCQIVVSAYNEGEGVSHNTIKGNTIDFGVTGIVVAADSPNTAATYNSVMDNTISNEFIPGIIIHSNTPGDVVSHNSVIGNTLSDNGADSEIPTNDGPTGIILIGAVTPVTYSVVNHNHIENEEYGIWSCNTLNSPMNGNYFSELTVDTGIHIQESC